MSEKDLADVNDLKIDPLSDEDLDEVAGGASSCCCTTGGSNCSNSTDPALEGGS